MVTGSAAWNGELAHKPAIGELVVQNDRVAVVAGFANAAKTLPERAASGRTVLQHACFTVNGKAQIDPLHVIIGADIAIGVRRQHAAQVGDAVEIDARGRRVG